MGRAGIALIVGIIGLAVGWYSAMAVSRGPVPSGSEEMHERMSNALTNDDMIERAETILKLVKNLTPENLSGAVEAFKEASPAPTVEIFDFRIFANGWAALAGEDMLLETATWPSERFQRVAVGAVMRDLAKKGRIQRAREVFDSLPDTHRSAAVGVMLTSWIEQGEYDSVASVIRSFPPGEGRNTAIVVFTAQMVRVSGIEALKNWVLSIPDDEPERFKRFAFDDAVRSISNESVEEATAWAMQGREIWWGRGGASALGPHWVKKDGVAAISWVESLPEGKWRNDAVRATLKKWAAHDPVSCADWMKSIAPIPLYDRTSERLSLYHARRDPIRAALFSNRIWNDELRAKTQKTLRFDWRRLKNKEYLYSAFIPGGPAEVNSSP